MTPDAPDPSASVNWRALETEARRAVDLRGLFAEDPSRGRTFVVEGAGLALDFSKQLVTADVLGSLLALAADRGLAARRDAMFAGAVVNLSERRAALHTALRLPPGSTLVVDGVDVAREVRAVLDRMADFAQRVRAGEWRGHTNQRIRHVVNIGIGGSDLGPQMASLALSRFGHDDLRFSFVSNVDGSDLAEALRDASAAETLFIVSSKTFSTLETLTNATSARRWLLDQLGPSAEVGRHFVAVSTAADRVVAFGIDPANMFGFWDWVGGRYSMDSAIGLSTMIQIGPESFDQMLAGFHDMDQHFATAPLAENLPVLHGLLAVWNRTFLGLPTVVVAPYDHYLRRLPAYLAQLTMESNGKRVREDGRPVAYETGAIHWGEPGTNAQHSFFQLLHQGTTTVPVDFIGVAESLDPMGEHQDMLVANLLAQARALAFGRSAEELAAAGVPEDERAHREMPGNRPSSVIWLERLSPRTLGSLVALYEHSVFTQGTIWGIDSFDQWGVELGKVIAQDILAALRSGATGGFDSSTEALLARYRASRPKGE